MAVIDQGLVSTTIVRNGDSSPNFEALAAVAVVSTGLKGAMCPAVSKEARRIEG